MRLKGSSDSPIAALNSRNDLVSDSKCGYYVALFGLLFLIS